MVLSSVEDPGPLGASTHINNCTDGRIILRVWPTLYLLFSTKFGTCTVVRVNGTLVEDKMR